MSRLPDDNEFNDPNTTEYQFRNALSRLLAYLRNAFGADGTVATIRSMLGLTGQPAAYTNRGAWATGTSYNVNDYVTNAGNTYLALNPLSNNLIAPSSDPTNWSLWQGVTLGQLGGTSAGQGAQLVGWIDGATGSVARTVDSKLDEIDSVLDFGADPTGVANCSAAFAAARAAVRYPYVPPGTYLAASCFIAEGFWGPGKVLVNGYEYTLPKSAVMAARIRTILAKFARSSWSLGIVGLFGDSISEGYYLTNIGVTWFNRLQRMLNATSGGGSDCEITNFADPNRYGLTISGTTAITASGPIQQAITLQAGASVSITGGPYTYADAVYDQQAGGGNLVIARGSTTLKTVSTTPTGPGNTALKDQSTFSTATGSTSAADVISFTASGGPVTLTGLWKLVQTIAPALFFSRMARSGQSTQLFSQDAVIASGIAHLNSLPGTGGRPVAIIALGINNCNTDNASIGTTPAVYEQQYGKEIARALNAGCYVICVGMIDPYKSNFATYRQNYAAMVATQRKVCEDYGVPLIAMDVVDFGGLGNALYDGLHPNDYGNDVMLELITEFLASDAFDPDGQKQGALAQRNYTPAYQWFSASSPMSLGGSNSGRYYRQGAMCEVIINMRGNAAGSAANGPLAVTLPFVANTGVNCSGQVGQAINLVAGTNNKQWTVEVAPGTQLAVIRSIDPATGAYSEVPALPANVSLDLQIRYIIQD